MTSDNESYRDDPEQFAISSSRAQHKPVGRYTGQGPEEPGSEQMPSHASGAQSAEPSDKHEADESDPG